MNAKDTALIVPAYNAARTIGRTLSRIAASGFVPGYVIVVDDGSHDGSDEIALRVGVEEYGLPVEVVRHEANRGYGAAQKSGFRRALERGARHVILVHADGQYAPEELPAMRAPLAQGHADVVIGSRVLGGALRGGMPPLRWIGNRVISHLENLVFRLKFVEYHTGYMAYSARALRAIDFDTLSDRFHFDGEMTLAAGKLGLRVAEIPVSTHFGPETSSLAVAPYLVEIGQVVVRYLKRGYFFQK